MKADRCYISTAVVYFLLFQKLNEVAFAQFEQEEDYTTPLTVVLKVVLPILDAIEAEQNDTTSLVSGIKDRWVHLLGEHLEGKQTVLAVPFSCQPFDSFIFVDLASLLLLW